MQTSHPIARRAVIAACWALPSLFCLWLYRYGLHTWFLQDDFAWLGVNVQIHDWNSFWHAVFVPSQQGTIRPLSERIFFIGFWHMFGWQAIYYRAFVFLTQFFNLILLSSIVWKLTSSRAAAFLAPILWTANASLAVPMSWTSGYNEILCAAFLLSAFYLFLRFQETGRWRYYWWQALVFILGFSALELNIIYPAIALCWVLLQARTEGLPQRTLLLSTLPLFVVSIVYYAVHASLAPRQSSGPYAMHFDIALLHTFWTYFHWAFVSPDWARITQLDPHLGTTAASAIGFSVAAFTVYSFALGQRLPAFFLAWFIVTLAPLVPLRDHLSDYYNCIPSLGFAVIAAIAVAQTWRKAIWCKAASVILLAAYFTLQIPIVSASTRWHYERSMAVRNLVLGVESAHRLHPTKTILLTDVSPELYDTAIAHRPFRLIDGAEVYLAPSSLDARPELTLPRVATARALTAESVEVYSAAAPRLRNVTSIYGRDVPREWASEYPRTVDAGNPFVAFVLGPSWYPLEGAYRWMPAQASVGLAGPLSLQQHLFVTGYCPKQMFEPGPVILSIAIDGQPAGEAVLAKVEGRFTQSFALPPITVGKPHIEIQLRVNHTIGENGAGRRLSLAFGIFEIR